MGPSGSGKTTLLDLLAGRKTSGSRTGDILFAGQPPSQQFLRRYTGYVEQFGGCLGWRQQRVGVVGTVGFAAAAAAAAAASVIGGGVCTQQVPLRTCPDLVPRISPPTTEPCALDCESHHPASVLLVV